ncbi:MAG: hypothetical protein AAB873_01085, partial [Patescibacteria group bacterium]
MTNPELNLNLLPRRKRGRTPHDQKREIPGKSNPDLMDLLDNPYRKPLEEKYKITFGKNNRITLPLAIIRGAMTWLLRETEARNILIHRKEGEAKIYTVIPYDKRFLDNPKYHQAPLIQTNTNIYFLVPKQLREEFKDMGKSLIIQPDKTK